MYPSNLSIHLLELSLPDLSKLIGDEWKKLSENQKAVSTNQNYFFRLLSVSDSYNQSDYYNAQFCSICIAKFLL